MSPNYSAIAYHCNLWRNYGDIQDSWASVLDIINFYGDNKDDFASVAGPGNWNDPDMVGFDLLIRNCKRWIDRLSTLK